MYIGLYHARYRCRILTTNSNFFISRHIPRSPTTATTRITVPIIIFKMDRSIANLLAAKESKRTGSRSGLVLSVSMFDTSSSDRVPTMIRPTPVNCTIQMYALLMVFIVIYVRKFPTKFSNIHMKTLSITSFLALDGLIKQ